MLHYPLSFFSPSRSFFSFCFYSLKIVSFCFKANNWRLAPKAWLAHPQSAELWKVQQRELRNKYPACLSALCCSALLLQHIWSSLNFRVRVRQLLSFSENRPSHGQPNLTQRLVNCVEMWILCVLFYFSPADSLLFLVFNWCNKASFSHRLHHWHIGWSALCNAWADGLVSLTHDCCSLPYHYPVLFCVQQVKLHF